MAGAGIYMKSFAKPSTFAGRKPPHAKQKGFIITIELILISTVLVIGTFVGVVAIRDALFKQYVQKQSREVSVYDANGLVLGKAVDYDEHEAPRIPYIDRTVAPLSPDPEHRNYRALIGIRDDRFTSREPVYYDGENCTGTPCIKASSDEAADNVGIENLSATGAVSYLYKMQGGPTYAIGRSPDGIKGFLFRETASACPVSPEAIKSRYMSQKVVTGSPCEAVGTAGGSTTTTTSTGEVYVADAYTDCLLGTPTTLGIVDACACPANYEQQNDVVTAAAAEIDASILVGLDSIRGFAKDVVNVVETAGVQVGTVCCPVGSVLSSTNLADTVAYTVVRDAAEATLTDARKLARTLETIDTNLTPGTIVCIEESQTTTPVQGGLPRTLVLKEAIQVYAPDTAENALAPFTAPFNVSLPADVGDDAWVYTLPGQEGRN
tara:strand:+ start:177 stop:1484 length:1308 start_codon:yes stop_codon:yes gene_type:complete